MQRGVHQVSPFNRIRRIVAGLSQEIIARLSQEILAELAQQTLTELSQELPTGYDSGGDPASKADF